MIEGVEVQEVQPHIDERGRLLELFREPGQVILTTVYPGAIKAWHRHARCTDTLVCVSGMIRLGVYDEREGSKTHAQLNEFFLGVHAPLKVRIPAGVWFGFKGIDPGESLVLVHKDQPYDASDPDEDTWDPLINEVPFDWERRDR